MNHHLEEKEGSPMTKLEEYQAEERAFQEGLFEIGGKTPIRTPLAEWQRAWRLGGIEGYLAHAAEDDAEKEALALAEKEKP